MPDAVHPRGFEDVAGHAPARVTLPSGSYSVDRGGDDPTIRDVTDADVRALADAYDVAAARVRAGDDTAETCDTVKADGEVCGRELPCPYHSE